MTDHRLKPVKGLISAALNKAIIILLLLAPFIATAQISDIRFRHISVEQGLSNSTINCVFQDSRGFMWFGTRDGLNRYDGVKTVIYKNDPAIKTSISDNFINCIYEDADHQLWIGTAYSLNKFDPYHNTFKRYSIGKPGGNGYFDAVTGICAGDKDHIWVSTLGAGVNLFDVHTGDAKHYWRTQGGLSSDTVTCLYRDNHNNIWAGTAGGLNVYNQGGANFTPLALNGLNPNTGIQAIAGDNHNNIWIGTTAQGAGLYNPQNKQYKSFTHNDRDTGSISGNLILDIHTDKKGNIWIGTINQGMNLYNPVNGSFHKYLPRPEAPGSLSNLTVSAIFDDNQGNLWVGTHRGGINLYTAESDKFKLYRQGLDAASLSYNDVKAFCEDSKGNIWVGTDGGGLDLFDQKKNTFQHFKSTPGNSSSLSSNSIQAIAEDGDHNLWVGTWGGGLNLMSGTSGNFTAFRANASDPNAISSDFLQRMFLDSKGNFWVATYGGGLNLLDTKTHHFKRITSAPDGKTSFSGNDVVSIGEDKNGRVWFGTDDGGLNCYDLAKQSFSHYFQHYAKKTDSRVIFTASNGDVWVGMEGLYLLDKKLNEFKLFTTRAGLGSDFIKGIIEDKEHRLWISTSAGVTRLTPATAECKQFTTYDGLQDLEFEANSYMQTRDGQVFFGGIKGFNSFYPDRIQPSSFVPPVYLTDFQIFDQGVNRGSKNSALKTDIAYLKTIDLDYRQSNIGFSFVALNYNLNRNNQYQYKMEGLDRDWVVSGVERKARYTNLEPGSYTFRVRASNSDGVWNSAGTSITIVITPPFWASWWFRLLMAVLVVGTLFILKGSNRQDL